MCWQSDSWRSHGRPEGDGDATDDWVGRADSWHHGWTETACLNQQPSLIDRILSVIVHEDKLRLHPCCFIYCVLQVLLTCFEFRWRRFSSEKRGCSQEIRNAEAQVPQHIAYILQPSKCWPDSGNKNPYMVLFVFVSPGVIWRLPSSSVYCYSKRSLCSYSDMDTGKMTTSVSVYSATQQTYFISLNKSINTDHNRDLISCRERWKYLSKQGVTVKLVVLLRSWKCETLLPSLKRIYSNRDSSHHRDKYAFLVTALTIKAIPHSAG